jgi:Tol biopolymer transport system component
MHGLRSRFLVPVFGSLFCASISAQVTQRVSVSSSGAQGNGDSDAPALSADGRYVVFASSAFNFYWHDVNGRIDVFARDRWAGTTELLCIANDGVPGNGNSGLPDRPSISADGRYVAFLSDSTNLVPGDTNGRSDVFVRDRRNLTTVRVSVSTSGTQGNKNCHYASISANGRFVAFSSEASNLVPNDTNADEDVFVHDLQAGTTELVSASPFGGSGNSWSTQPSISADGRFVAFVSSAFNLLHSGGSGEPDIYVRDRWTGTNERVSAAVGGGAGNGPSWSPSISADGRFVAFSSSSSNLIPGDNGGWDVFVRDRRNGTTELANVSSNGAQGSSPNGFNQCSISADGRYVAFESDSTILVPGDTNGYWDVFVHDRWTGTTERVSVATDGSQANNLSGLNGVSISADGRAVAYGSRASNLTSGDTNQLMDVFIHDRSATSFSSHCAPGIRGVIDCPCSNAPASPGRGCDDSSAAGGAILAASGIAYLSIDSLVFTTSGERSTALSVLMQGNALLTHGVVYGQGVRCVGGTIKRLFTKTASGGSITAPDFGAGDPTISARSIAKGDVIQPGQSRYYLVCYRDPVVLGGCPASATFNATQTGQISWWP